MSGNSLSHINTGYYQKGRERSERVRRLFRKIARRYDFINDLQSLGLHRIWKRNVVQALRLQPGNRLLDLATGTGDLIFRAGNVTPNLERIGGDYTYEMLKVAGERSQADQNLPRPDWVQLDGHALPFRADTFHAVSMVYGLRNMAEPKRCLNEIARVVQPSGRLVILDFGKPPFPPLRALYFFVLKYVQPFIGWLFFRDAQTYRYIYQSLQEYAAQEGVARMLVESGFESVECRNLCGGIMSIHTAIKRVT